MKKKKNIILLIVINFLLTITKFLIAVDFTARAFLNSFGKRDYLIFFIGVLINICLDLLINYFAVKIANKKEGYNRFKLIKVVIIPIIITIIFMILGLV